MKVYDAEHIRNIALVGHSGSGKTQLASALLFDANAVNRLGLVACKLHGKGTGRASALRVPYSRPPEVMDQFFGAASLSGRNIPG